MKRRQHPRAYFTSSDIARRAGLTRPTINTYLRWLGIRRMEGAQHRFDADQVEEHVGRLKGFNEKSPVQPLKAFPKELRNNA